jgi:hypothetical protein
VEVVPVAAEKVRVFGEAIKVVLVDDVTVKLTLT